MAVTLREFATKWGFEVNDDALKKLDAKFFETRQNMQKVADKATQVGQKLSLFATVPITAFAAISTNMASDAADFENRLKTVFKGISDEGVKAIDTFGISVGLSTIEIQKMIGGMGQLLKNMGFTEEQSLATAQSVATLSADIAEFNNVEGGAAAVSDAITASLSGRTMALKEFGISISKESIAQQIATDKSNGLRFANEKAAQAQAILTLVTKQSANAAGAFTNATDDLGVSQAKLKAKVTNITVAFGKILLPIAIKITDVLGRVADMFLGMSKGTQTAILVILGLVAALGPMLIIFGSVLNGIMAIRTAMILFGNQALLAWLKAISGFLLFAAAAAAIFLIFDDIKGYFEGKDSVIGTIIAAVDSLVDSFQTSFPILGTIVRAFIVGALTPLNLLINTIRTIAGVIGSIVGGGGISGAIDALKQGATDFLSPFKALRDGTNFSLGEAIGFGERSTLPQVRGAGTSNNQNVNAPITVNVPQGTPPEQVGPAVQRGVSEGLGSLLRETKRQTTTPVVN